MAKRKVKKKAGGRDARVCSATGTTGTGKSYKARKAAEKLASNNKVLVLTYAGSGDTWDDCKKIAPTKKALSFKTGWHKIHIVEHSGKEDTPILNVANYFRNGVVILDDCVLYMSSNWGDTKGLQLLCVDHRFNQMDLIFIAHSPSHISKQCWAYIKYSWIFKCGAKLRFKDMPMENFEVFINAQNAVNKLYAVEFKKINRKPRGIYKFANL